MGTVQDVLLPDIGDFEAVEVIEVLVNSGDTVNKDDSLITLESDKATMEIPAPYAGVVKDLKVAVGDKLSKDGLILTLEVADQPETRPNEEPTPAKAAEAQRSSPEPAQAADTAAAPEAQPRLGASVEPVRPPGEKRQAPPPVGGPATTEQGGKSHASPAIRRFARELGVDLYQVSGTGSKGRVLKQDVETFVKAVMARRPTIAGREGFVFPEMPVIDFAQFGEIETRPLSRIKKISGPHLQRSWITVPHVTQFDEADITQLEVFRKSMAEDAARRDVKLTPLVFMMKAAAAALKEFPEFNASLDPNGENLILKKYVHIGVAVDTPEGLVVPVIRDVDTKGLFDLAGEVSAVANRARERKLVPAELQGGCFSISSLGGIGGTAFTPIVNAPEVAVLGVSRAQMKPVYREDRTFQPALMLPISLSYDHRVIDGAAAARFTTYLCGVLSDIRRLLL